jgi:hypothetical protein
MTQLGGEIDPKVVEVRDKLSSILSEHDYFTCDASSYTTGRDFLLKIWETMISVPIGIGIVHEGIRPDTLGNIFYELGIMQALGKETLVIKIGDIKLPSDFVRTEYVPYNGDFEQKLEEFIRNLEDRVSYYTELSECLESNPLLAMTYLKRAFLLSNNQELKERKEEMLEKYGINERPKDCVEALYLRY